jgi:acetate---CoA ligase (ADP-forming)
MRRAVMDAGLTPLQGLHDAFDVLSRCAGHSALRKTWEAGRVPAVPFTVPRGGAGRRIIDEAESKRRLAAFGLKTPAGRLTSFDGLRDAASCLDGPLALKAISTALPHKTEAGAVALGLAGAEAVAEAAEAMRRRIAAESGIDVDSFLVEAMVKDVLAELIIGIKSDPHFGMVLVIGAGGILVELINDSCRLLLPASRDEIEAGLRGLKVFRLLDGYRGRPKADTGAIVGAIEAVVSYALANIDRIAEIDVNPLMISEGGKSAIAADALIIEHA